MLRIVATTSAVFVAAAVPALAEVTPAQVWENLSQYYTDFGYSVEVGAQDDTGATLTLTDVVIRMSEGSEDVDFSFTVPSMVLSQTGDEKVRTVINGDVTGTVGGQSATGEDFSVNVTVAMPGNEMTTSGTLEDMQHEYTYPSTVATVAIDGVEGLDGAAPLTLTINNLTGSQSTKKGGDIADTSYDMAAESVSAAVAFKQVVEQGQAGDFRGTFQVDAITAEGTLQSPTGQFDLTNRLGAALAAGFATEGKITAGATRGEFTVNSPEVDGTLREGTGQFTSESTELTVDMSADGLSYEGGSTGINTVMNMPDVPFPITYQVARFGGGVAFPVTPSQEPQPFGLNYEIEGLAMAEEIWGMFDPEAKLPRDPASLTVDLDGTMVVTKDIFDPAFAESMEPSPEGTPPEMPWIPKTLTITEVALDAIGATADLTGELTFGEDPSQPVGTIDGSFSGVNTLLDNLSAIGLITADQVMPARMMMAMFATPVEGETDKFQTKLEFREGGSIFANGQQVR